MLKIHHTMDHKVSFSYITSAYFLDTIEVKDAQKKNNRSCSYDSRTVRKNGKITAKCSANS